MKTLNLKVMQKKADNIGFGADDRLFLGKEVQSGGDMNVRVLTPRGDVDVPWVTIPVYWIERTPYTSPEILGEMDFFADEVEAVKDEFSGNKNALRRINAKANSKEFGKSFEYCLAVAIFDFKYDENDDIANIWVSDINQDEASEIRKTLLENPKMTMQQALAEYDIIIEEDDENIGKCEPVDFSKLKDCIVGGKIHELVVGATAIKAYAKTLSQKALIRVAGKAALKGLDRVVGFNTIFSKTGKGKKTEYGAEHDLQPLEMPEWTFENKHKPDILELAKKRIKPEAFLRAVVRAYLLDEEAPEIDDYDEDKEERGVGDRHKTTRKRVTENDEETGNTGTTTSRRKRLVIKEDDDEPISTKRRRKVEPEIEPEIEPENEYKPEIKEAVIVAKKRRKTAVSKTPAKRKAKIEKVIEKEEGTLDADIQEYDDLDNI